MRKNGVYIIHILRILVALIFILSGLIKINDPLGFSYKLDEYFEVFHTTALIPYSVLFAILLCSLEIVLGTFLMLKTRYTFVLKCLLFLILFFCFLTFYSAFFNVVKTCGCFGDALPLKPWTSFIKDLFLFIAIVILYYYRRIVVSKFLKKSFIFLISTVPILLGLYTYFTLPIIDFLPYKVGANIPSLMKVKDGAAVSEYQILYDLKNIKTGEQKTLTDKDYLSTKIYLDTTWKLIKSSEPQLIKQGDEPVIKDLAIYDDQGVSYTTEIFDNPYYNLLVVAYNLDDTNLQYLGNINALAINALEQYHVKTILLTASSAKDAQHLIKKMNLQMDVFYADAVPLKSMVRSNPGVILMKNGIIIQKWSGIFSPNFYTLHSNYLNK